MTRPISLRDFCEPGDKHTDFRTGVRQIIKKENTVVTMKDSFITFGVQYLEEPTSPESTHPLGMFGRGYATIQAPDSDTARNMALALFGKHWAFDYREKPRQEYVPAGEILRVVVLQRAELTEATDLLDAAYGEAVGGSNDDELEALHAVREFLADVVGYEQ